MKQLSKNEIKLLEEELIPLNLSFMVEGDRKNEIKYLINIHDLKKQKDFSETLKQLSLEKNEFFNKAFQDTLDLFFENENLKFKKDDILLYKEQFLYLISFDIFSFNNENIFAFYFFQFLKHINETFQTRDNIKYGGDSAGTAFFNNGYIEGTQKHYNQINNNLNPRYPLSVTSQEDIERSKILKFNYRTFRNHLNISNYLITLNALYDVDNMDIDMTIGQKKGFKQSFKFLNGLKTSPETLLRSFMIKASFPYREKNINKTKLSQIIKDISRQFFEEIVYNKKTKKYKVGFSPRYLKRKVYIKTVAGNNLIYAYDTEDKYTFLWQMTMDRAIEFYTKMLKEEGYGYITEHKCYKSLMKKIFSTTIFPM
jgi:hypothetical protein